MSSNLKSPLEGLKNAKCKKGKLIARPPIPDVSTPNLHERQETEQITVKMPDGTNFQMAALHTETTKSTLSTSLPSYVSSSRKGWNWM